MVQNYIQEQFNVLIKNTKLQTLTCNLCKVVNCNIVKFSSDYVSLQKYLNHSVTHAEDSLGQSVSVGTATEMCVHSHALTSEFSFTGWITAERHSFENQAAQKKTHSPPSCTLGRDADCSEINYLEFLEFPSQTLCVNPGLLAVAKVYFY